MAKNLAAPVSVNAAEPVDGRRSRTVETRKRIVKALTELIREGRHSPTAEDVSVRANVGLRTVFRHFDDMETLYREIQNEVQGIIGAMLHLQYSSNVWQEQLVECIEARCRLYEGITPFFISAQVHRGNSVVIDLGIRYGIDLERAVLKRIIPADIQSDKPRFEALIMALSPEAWVRLRREQGLAFGAALASLQLLARALTQT